MHMCNPLASGADIDVLRPPCPLTTGGRGAAANLESLVVCEKEEGVGARQRRAKGKLVP